MRQHVSLDTGIKAKVVTRATQKLSRSGAGRESAHNLAVGSQRVPDRDCALGCRVLVTEKRLCHARVHLLTGLGCKAP